MTDDTNDRSAITTTCGIGSRALPEGWKWTRLQDVCKPYRKSVKPSDTASRSLPYLGLEHVESETGRILSGPKDLMTDDIRSISFHFNADHVLYGKLRPYLNKVAVAEFEGRCTSEIVPLEPIGVARDYLAILLRRKESVDYAMAAKTGSRMPRTDMKHFMGMPIPLPPILEQRRIVRAIDERLQAIDRARRAAERLIEAAESMAAAYLRAVFPKQNDKLPEGWDRVRLGDVCESVESTNPKREPERHFRYVEISSIDRLTKRITATKRFRGANAPGRARRSIRANDILVSTTRPNLNAVAVVPNDLDGQLGSTGLCVLRPKRDLAPQFLFSFVQTQEFVSLLSDRATGSTYPAVTDEDVRGLEIPLPSMIQQERIVRGLRERLRITDTASRTARSQLDALTVIPVSYQNRALAGDLT